MLTVPFTSDYAQTFDVVLGGATYSFAARFNDWNGVWTFDITVTATQVQLVAGVPLLIGQDMLAPYALGIGGLTAADMETGGIDAGPDDLGARVIVSWLSPDEIAAIAAAGAIL